MNEPLEVQVWRGELIESRHQISACVIDGEGTVTDAFGAIDQLVFPRSSIKPLQALPLVETGALDFFEVGEEALALACASHGGEPLHVERVSTWLDEISCSPSDLECGAQSPLHRPSARTLRRDGEVPSALHNTCSGKHTGMLSVARHLGHPTQNYIKLDHPVQQLIREYLSKLTGRSLGIAAVDGCGVPTYATTLRDLAYAGSEFMALGDVSKRILAAMGNHPLLVAGHDQCDSSVMATASDLVVKTGAEGVYLAFKPDQSSTLALKAHDGATRASEVALLGLLHRLDWIDHHQWSELRTYALPPVVNAAGDQVGHIKLA